MQLTLTMACEVRADSRQTASELNCVVGQQLMLLRNPTRQKRKCRGNREETARFLLRGTSRLPYWSALVCPRAKGLLSIPTLPHELDHRLWEPGIRASVSPHIEHLARAL